MGGVAGLHGTQRAIEGDSDEMYIMLDKVTGVLLFSQQGFYRDGSSEYVLAFKFARSIRGRILRHEGEVHITGCLSGEIPRS